MEMPWLIGRVSPDGAWHVVTDHRVGRMENIGSWASACGRFQGHYSRSNELALERPRMVATAHRARVCGHCLRAVENALEHHQRTVWSLQALNEASR